MKNDAETISPSLDSFSFLSDFIKILILAIVYFLAHGVSFFFPDSSNVIMLIWPASGIGLAAFLLNKKQLWPFLALAFVISGISADVFLAHRSLMTGIGFMTANMIESIGCALLILHFSRDFQKFDRVIEILTLLASTIFINAFSSCIGAYTSVLESSADFGKSWWSWYIADGLGILLVGPFIVNWTHNFKNFISSLHLEKIIEIVAVIIVCTIVTYFIFFQETNFLSRVFHPYMLVALIIWPAIRLGMKGITTILLIFFIFALFSPAISVGPSPWGGSDADLVGRFEELQLFLMFLAIVGYLMSAGYTSLMYTENSLRQSEDDLKKSKARLQRAEITSKSGNWELHLKTNTVIASEGAERLYGIRGDQVGYSTIKNIPLPEYRSILDNSLNDLVKKGDPYNLEFKIQNAETGKIIDIYSIANYDKDNKIVYGVIQDITERKHIEEELIKAKEKAEESDQLKSAFLANMSHEIRTPMNGILGFANILKTQDITNNQQREYIEIIEKSGVRMLKIINDIIDISKIESGQMKVSLSDTNVNEQIEFIYNFFIEEVEKRGILLTYKTSLDHGNAIILTDNEKLYAILANLVKNAMKFTNEGSIEFGYTLIHALGVNDDVDLTFFVKDTGIGIPDNRKDAIFERFIQGDISDKMVRQGAGLGLAISKAYVEMLGGKIWFESEEGIGTTFYFTIPYLTSRGIENVNKPKLVQSVESPLINKLKTLIVEDDEDSVKLLLINIKKFCKEVLVATNGVDAVELIRNNSDVDLVLMDIKIPGINGYEATRQIREFNTKVIIVAQTAYALFGDKEKSLKAGCNEYLSKPILTGELHTLIERNFTI